MRPREGRFLGQAARFLRQGAATGALAALVLAACGGGGGPGSPTTSSRVGAATSTSQAASSTSQGTSSTVPLLAGAALEYVPGTDSFSFENFGGGEAPAGLTVNLVRRMYGDAQVCSEVAEGRCTPYPVILQLIRQANRSMKGGLCEGLAVLSLRLAGDPAALGAFQSAEAVAALAKEDPALLARPTGSRSSRGARATESTFTTRTGRAQAAGST